MAQVVGIAAKAFSKCKALTKAVIGAKVTSVGAKAFNGAKKLKTLVVGAKVATIGKLAFKGCKKLKAATVKSGALKKASCKNLVKSTKIVKIKLAGKAAKKMKKKYKKFFPKKNAGKKLKIS